MSHHSHTFLDHCLVVFDTSNGVVGGDRRPFHFEAEWLMEESCDGEVSRLWGTSIGSLPSRLTHISKVLAYGLRKFNV